MSGLRDASSRPGARRGAFPLSLKKLSSNWRHSAFAEARGDLTRWFRVGNWSRFNALPAAPALTSRGAKDPPAPIARAR